MSDLISRTARLVPYAKRPKHMASFVTAYFYEPAADEAGARLGNLFVAVEVLVSGRASEEVVDLVIQTAGDKYYNDPLQELDPLARFEAAVKQTNHELSEYVGRGNAAWIGKLSAIMAVQAGKELHVTQTGSAEAFLYRGKAVSRISVTEPSRPATPNKTFGSIATGELEAGDKLLLATPALVHQVPLKKLQSLIASLSPNAAIQEISQLLEGATTNRIAAIVIEITTPELAALKVRSEAPDEIQLAGGESLAEAAIGAALPIAQTTAQSSRKAAEVARGGWQRIKPRLQAAGFAAAGAVRQALSTSKGRRIGAIATVVVVLVLGLFIWNSSMQAGSAKNFAAYQTLYQQFTAAQTAASSGDKMGARDKLVSIQAEINKLGGSEAGINHQLKNNPLSQGEPSSVADFKVLVADAIDVIDGLIKVSPMTVAQIGGKNSQPLHFESDGAKAYVIDSSNDNMISIVNLLTGTQKDTAADTTRLGDVKNTTLSANNDGMFILTAKPSVWFYRFANDSLTEQTLAYGEWEKSHAIASYASNLYTLGDTAVYKHVKNATGYSPKTDYISTTAIAGSTGLGVDGWVYVATKSGLNRYLGPTLKQTAALPTSLSPISNIRSVSAGSVVIGTSAGADRIAFWNADDTQVAFSKQVALTDGKNIYDATYDKKLGKVFATVDNRLVSFSFKP